MKIKKIITKIKCRLNLHHYSMIPIVADLDHFWLQGGLECKHCTKKIISFEDVSRVAKYAYIRGKE